jgi:hypothetical protein
MFDRCVAAYLRGNARAPVESETSGLAERSLPLNIDVRGTMAWLAGCWVQTKCHEPPRYPDAVSYLGLIASESGPRWYAEADVIIGFIPGRTDGHYRVLVDASPPTANGCAPSNDGECCATATVASSAVQRPALHTQYAAVTIACVCGEDAHGTMSGFDTIALCCVCGRNWSVRMSLEQGVPEEEASLVCSSVPDRTVYGDRGRYGSGE